MGLTLWCTPYMKSTKQSFTTSTIISVSIHPPLQYISTRNSFLKYLERVLAPTVKVLRPTRHKIGHFSYVLPSLSLDILLTKLTQQKHTYTNNLTHNNPKKLNLTQINCSTQYKLNLTNKQQSVKSVRMCVIALGTLLLHTTLHRTETYNFPYPSSSNPNCSGDVYLRKGAP